MEIDEEKLRVVAEELCISETDLKAKAPCQGEDPDCFTCWKEALKKEK